MTLTLEIPPRVFEALERAAKERGVAVEAFALSVLEEYVATKEAARLASAEAGFGMFAGDGLSVDEFLELRHAEGETDYFAGLQRQISFQPIALADAPLLFRWRQTPHVARWWNIAPYEANTLDEMRRELEEDLELGEHESLLVLLDDAPIGYAQTYNAGKASGEWWPDELNSTRGLDLLIGEESLVGQGIGPLVVRALCERLFEDVEVTSIIVDPHPDNLRSVRCFEKAGFQRERELQTPDGAALLLRLKRENF